MKIGSVVDQHDALLHSVRGSTPQSSDYCLSINFPERITNKNNGALIATNAWQFFSFRNVVKSKREAYTVSSNRVYEHIGMYIIKSNRFFYNIVMKATLLFMLLVSSNVKNKNRNFIIKK